MTDKCVLAILANEKFKDVPQELIEEIVKDIREKGGDLRRVRERSKETLDWMKAEKAEVILGDKRMDELDAKYLDDPNVVHEAFLVGSTKTGTDLKKSVSVNREVITMKHQQHADQLFNDVLEIVDDPIMTEKIFVAIDNMNKNIKVPEGPIRDVAQRIRDMNKYIVQELNKAGINIKDRADYILRQTHDIGKLANSSFEEWADFTYDKLNLDESFGPGTTKKQHYNELRRIYRKIVSSEYGTQGSASLGRARTLHFTDGKAASAYHTEYGEGSIYEVLQRTIRSAAKAEAIRRVHPGGRDAFIRLEKRQEQRILDSGDKELIKKFKKGRDARENMRRQIFGYGDHPSSHWFAEALKAARTLSAITKLPFAAASTFTDIAPATANYLAKTGNKALKGQLDVLRNYFKSFKGENRKRLASIIMMNSEFDTVYKYTDSEGMRGIHDKVVNWSMKMTLLDKITKINRNTMALTFAEHFANDANVPFDKLHKRAKAEFKAFGITPEEWEVIRPNTIKVLGTKIIDISKIENRDTQIKFMTMLWHNAKFGAISPGDATKSIIRFGAEPNSVLGQSFATIMQFKTFPMEAARAIQEIAKSNPDANNATLAKSLKNTDNRKLMTNFMALSLGSAAVGLWARDLLNGKEPRDLTPGMMAEAFSRSVIPIQTQILTDVLTGTYHNMGRNLTVDVLGPTASLIAEAGSLASTAALSVVDDKVDPRGKAFRFFRRNTPIVSSFVNAPILKPLLDTWFIDGWNEQWNPGYKRRKIRRDLEKGSGPLFR